jgi:hypothetical protein
VKKKWSRTVTPHDNPLTSPTPQPLVTRFPSSEEPIASGSALPVGPVANSVQGNQMTITMSGGSLFFGSLSPDMFTSDPLDGSTPYSPLVHMPIHPPLPASNRTELASAVRSRTHPCPSTLRQKAKQTGTRSLSPPGTNCDFIFTDRLTPSTSSPTQMYTDLPDVPKVIPRKVSPYQKRRRKGVLIGDKVCQLYISRQGCRYG